MENTHKIKICTSCKEPKNTLEFKSAKTTNDKFSPICIVCKRKYDKEYRDKNKEKIKDKKRTYQIENKIKIAEKKSAYYKKNIDKIKTNAFNNKDRIKKLSQIRQAKNKDSIAKARRIRYLKNRKEEIASATLRIRKWHKTEEGKLTLFIRSSIGRAIKYTCEEKKISSTKSLDYSIKELKNNIEGKFTEGMNWDNYGVKGWHIDHISPISNLIKINKGKSQREINNIVNSLDNLQPLWAEDNLKKGSKLQF